MMMSEPRQCTVCGADKLVLRLDLRALYDLEQGRIAGIGAAIDNMQIGRAHTGHDQIFPLHARIAMARRARVPAHMMKLIANTRHLQTRNHLAVGRTLRVGIDGAQIVRLLNARAGVNGDRIEQLFARCLHRLGGRSITRSTAMFGHGYFPKFEQITGQPQADHGGMLVHAWRWRYGRSGQ